MRVQYADGGVTLRALGAAEVQIVAGDSPARVLLPPKSLALFAYLVLARSGTRHRRDLLLDWFWPGLDRERARIALNKHVHLLRQQLGAAVLVREGEVLSVAPNAVRCDAHALERAVRDGQNEEVVALYAGELLPGVTLPESRDFGYWIEGEREHYRRVAVQALLNQARRAAHEARALQVVELAERAVQVAGPSEIVLREAVTALLGAGDRAAALRLYHAFERRLQDDLDAAPSPETRHLLSLL